MHPFDERFDRARDRLDRAQEKLWNKFEAGGRRGGGWGMGGPGRGGWGNWGDWGGFGDNFRIGRMLASGDLRLIALYFIEQQPRHGYDLIKAIEEKTGGIYVPSPGVIYPALTFLEEANYATSTSEGNKRLYTITDEGRAHLGENRQAVETTLEYLGKIGEKAQSLRAHWDEMERRGHRPGPQDGPHRGPGHGPHDHGPHDHGPRPDRDMDDVPPDVNEARRALKQAIREAARDPHNHPRLAEILRRAAQEIRGGGPAPAEDDVDL